MASVYALILAGGSGTRFWPASRRRLPKQLLPLAPGDSESLIARTVERLGPLCSPDRVFVSTGVTLADATREVLSQVPAQNFLVEPYARNTAPCIAWACSEIAARDPHAVVITVPSDHHIGDVAEYERTLRVAVETAANGSITTLGITPSRPDTGFGYIEVAELGAVRVAAPVKRFVEKPTEERAREYLDAGTFYWNSGMFVFRVDTMLAAMHTHWPEVSAGLASIDAARGSDEGLSRRAVAKAFEQWPSISIDYAVMERASGVQVVPADMGWSDLGGWQTSWELASKDADGNALGESAVAVASHRNLVRDLSSPSAQRQVALVGVDDLCVIQTDDAVLIVRRERAQEVRDAVERLRQLGRDDLL